ncbi:MAG: hypothetical protein H6506_01475 [Calditrichaeota bacterium]|nr:hypothetical protein [Calditrichota bacterium]MCB9367336.1 hypothetical protein [Calditrichota bacterium]MCB9391302.1 hypothetical protein [Calditrichota bacterium]
MRLLIAMLLTSMIGFAQGLPPLAGFYLESGVLTDEGLNKGTPLPDGTDIFIYWDVDSDGPDAEDPLPPVGDKGGMANWSSFSINSADIGGKPGQFLSDPLFTTVGYITDPPRYYLRVCLPDRQIVSNVFVLKSETAEFDVTDWTVVKEKCIPRQDKPEKLKQIEHE